jgi:hypothetical protein
LAVLRTRPPYVRPEPRGLHLNDALPIARQIADALEAAHEQGIIVSDSVKGDTFVAEKPRVWSASLGGPTWDVAPDGKRVAVVIAETAGQAPEQEHGIVMLLNFADELRRRVPGK